MALSARIPHLAELEVLVAVAHTGSLNAAARHVGVTQQAVSARIRSAEARAGVCLVSRTSRGSTLTPEGVVVAEWAARLLAVAGELDAGLAALRNEHHTRLRVSASLTIAEQLLPGWLVSLQAAAQHRGGQPAQIVLTAANSETVAQQVRQGSADLGFVEGPGRPKGLRSRVIRHDTLVVVVRPDHPWARRRQPLGPAELAATALVSREEGSGTRDALAAALAAALPRTRAVGRARGEMPIALALSTTTAVRAAVVAGAGPAVLSELAVTEDLAAQRLARVMVEDVDLRRALRAIWSGGPLPPRGAARDLLSHVTRPRPRAGQPSTRQPVKPGRHDPPTNTVGTSDLPAEEEPDVQPNEHHLTLPGYPGKGHPAAAGPGVYRVGHPRGGSHAHPQHTCPGLTL